jgi:hypothetical protein
LSVLYIPPCRSLKTLGVLVAAVHVAVVHDLVGFSVMHLVLLVLVHHASQPAELMNSSDVDVHSCSLLLLYEVDSDCALRVPWMCKLYTGMRIPGKRHVTGGASILHVESMKLTFSNH